jgi:hypothetical protein
MAIRGNAHAAAAIDVESDDGSDTDDVLSDTGTASNDENESNNLLEAPATEYPIMHNLGINIDLSISLNANYVKSLLGELLSLQLEHSTEDRKATNEYFRYKSVHTVYAVSLMPHATEDAYKRYHRKAPYIQELIDVMVKNQSADFGSIRLAAYLATNHEKLYVDVAMQKGLAITGIMDEVESAAMWRDARVLDNQARTILRHLRYKSRYHSANSSICLKATQSRK